MPRQPLSLRPSNRIPRRALLTLPLLALTLGACAQQPLRRGAEQAEAWLTDTRINPIAGEGGQVLRNALLQQLAPASGNPAAPRYQIATRLTLQELGSGIELEADASSRLLTASASLDFAPLEAGDAIARVTALNQSSYGLPDSSYGARAAREAAIASLLVPLAADLASNLRSALADL